MNGSFISPITCVCLAGSLLTACQSPETDRDLFLKTDSNNDGRLSLPEVKAVGLPRLFARFDSDGDGSVSLSEARAVEPDFAASEFTSRDLNSDGKVTFAEYREVAQHKSRLNDLFDKIDANKDGYITGPEADAHIAALENQQP